PIYDGFGSYLECGDFDGDGYDDLGLDPEDFGLIYAYPWPGEEEVVEQIFAAVAATGALLLTYRSTEDLVLQRKT
ncbi:MAG: hypothetical protein AAGL98_12790, partial [Planctomycetota bacterium]